MKEIVYYFGCCISGQKYVKNRKVIEYDVYGCVQSRFRDYCDDNEEVVQYNGYV